MKVARPPYPFPDPNSIPAADIARREIGPAEAWHQVGAAGEPAYVSPFIASGYGEPLKFRKTPAGLIEFIGSVDMSGAGGGAGRTITGTLFTLPLGYRPNRTIGMRLISLVYWSGGGSQTLFMHIEALSNGNVIVGTNVLNTLGALIITFNPLRFQLAIQR